MAIPGEVAAGQPAAADLGAEERKRNREEEEELRRTEKFLRKMEKEDKRRRDEEEENVRKTKKFFRKVEKRKTRGNGTQMIEEKGCRMMRVMW